MSYNIIVMFSFVFQNSVEVFITENIGGKNQAVILMRNTAGHPFIYVVYMYIYRLRWSRGSVLAFSTQDCGFKPGRSRRIFRAKKSSALLPSEGI